MNHPSAHQVYGEYHCKDAEKFMECEVDPLMEVRAVTNAKWYGAPGPYFCGPKSKYPTTGETSAVIETVMC